MEMHRSDSSGTDDDLPPLSQQQQQQQQRGSNSRVVGNGKNTATYAPAAAATTATTTSNKGGGIDPLVRTLEQEAYTAVLRAFSAQADTITWAKELLISDLRKELRVTDEQHRVFLAKVRCDDSVRQVREWRESEGPSAAAGSTGRTSPPASQSRKKQKISAAPPTMPPPPPPPSKPQAAPPPAAATKKGSQRGKNSNKGAPFEKISGKKRKESALDESLVGQTIKMRWPDDNAFYNAYVREFHKEDRMHTLVYDLGTEKESSERVDLTKVAPDDVQLNLSELKPKKIGRNTSSDRLGSKKRVTPPERGPSQKWAKIDRKGAGVRRITVPSFDDLAKQVEDLDNEPDHNKIEHLKRLAKEHEEILRKVLGEIGNDSDEGESDDRGNRHRNGYSSKIGALNNMSDEEDHPEARHAYLDAGDQKRDG